MLLLIKRLLEKLRHALYVKLWICLITVSVDFRARTIYYEQVSLRAGAGVVKRLRDFGRHSAVVCGRDKHNRPRPNSPHGIERIELRGFKSGFAF